MDIKTNFILGKMNKSVDERLIPPGQYIDAQNVRLGSTEGTEIGAVENSKGNSRLTTIEYGSAPLSALATCIGTYADGVNENIYWFVHDPANSVSVSQKVDLIVSYNTTTEILRYHIQSELVLNFDPQYLITGINLIENLLFFTDNINPPRKINIQKNYEDPSSGVDGITSEQISVIVKPPGFSSYTDLISGLLVYELAAPKITLLNITGEENYIKDKFLSFAYRYQYTENEYSATSLYTVPAFESKPFVFDDSDFNNEGMVNFYNSVDVTFNTGSNQVIAVEVLFKESGSNSIYVIERYKKSERGWPDNDTRTIRFTNSKIYSVIGQDELLRWYDNVPRIAQAQTIMGNRLIFGNYLDQYNIETIDNQPIAINFTATPDSIAVLLGGTIATATINGPLNTILPTSTQDVTDSTVSFIINRSLTALPILAFSEFIISLQITSAVNSNPSIPLAGGTTNPLFPTGWKQNEPSEPLRVEATFITQQQYNTYFDFLQSAEFAAAVGIPPAGTPGASGLTTISPSANYGPSLSDQFYTQIKAPLSPTYPADYVLQKSGNWDDPTTGNPVTTQQGFNLTILSIPNIGDVVTLQCPAVKYQYSGTSTVNVYEYFSFTNSNPVGSPSTADNSDQTINFSNAGNSLSLHSNRNYDTAIMYMDDYGRSSTALVSPDNTVFFQPDDSLSLNRISISIFSVPPYWATRYKYLIKPTEADYNIVYSNEIFTDSQQPNVSWVRLEGQTTGIVEKGDVLRVKIDSRGNTPNTDVTTTVLAVEAKAAADITALSPAGLYMKIMPRGFTATSAPFAIVANGQKVDECTACLNAAQVKYPLYYNDGTSDVNYTLPEGSVVQMELRVWRSSKSWCDSVNTRTVPNRKEWVLTNDYSDFYDWWSTAAIDPNDFIEDFGEDGFVIVNDITSPGTSAPTANFGELLFWFTSDNYVGGDPLFLNVAVTRQGCSIGIDKRPIHVELRIVVNRNQNFMAFETMPAVADPNLFYDSSEMYIVKNDINNTLAHMGNGESGSQDQVVATNTPAIVILPFANCFAFGNGIESYRYKDLPAGKSFDLGERQTAVSNTVFAEANRFAGLTYSGIFNGSSNLNNLNEFNLGLVNFKDLELIFGPIMKMYARQTDVLVLQEDRISYVLAGKNLLSDSTGGGVITSVPEVLGQQIARIEEYGISFNPESFASWGSSMFFADAKRGAVLKLTGTSMANDSLEIISTFGLRSYFRDKFALQLNSQKLGGYDPYMDEYVFSSNNISLPMPPTEVGCGTLITQQDSTASYTILVDVGATIGDIEVVFTPASSGAKVDITTDYDGSVVTNTDIIATTTLSVSKTSLYPSTIEVTVSPSEVSSYNIIVNCTDGVSIFVTYVVLTDPQSGLTNPTGTIHSEYFWTDPSSGFSSPLESIPVTMNATTNISYYNGFSAEVGQGMVPFNGCTVTLISNKLPGDAYTFNDIENRFYAFTDSLNPASGGAQWAANKIDLLQPTNNLPLTPIVNTLIPTTSAPYIATYQATSDPLVIDSAVKTLYLVWDFRDRGTATMCYSQVNESAGCNGCNPLNGCVGSLQGSTPVAFYPGQSSYALACNSGNGPGGSLSNMQHTVPQGLPSTNDPAPGDVCYKACGNNPLNCCDRGVVMDPGFYFLQSQSVIEIGANGECLSNSGFPCN